MKSQFKTGEREKGEKGGVFFNAYTISFAGLTLFLEAANEKFRIRETKNLSTDGDSRTDTILERLGDLFFKKNRGCVIFTKKQKKFK